jgi:hypothetical protein
LIGPEGEKDEVSVNPSLVNKARSGLYDEIIDAGVAPSQAYDNLGEPAPWLAVLDGEKYVTSLLPRERKPALKIIGKALSQGSNQATLSRYGNFLGP